MRRALRVLILTFMIAIPAHASEIMAPDVYASGRDIMPQNTDTFGEGLLELLRNCMKLVKPELLEASRICGTIVFVTMVFTILLIISPKMEKITAVAASVSITAAMFQQTNGLLATSTETVRDILDYGKLLCQVMATALAAQGGVTASSALYVGTTLFLTILNFLISKVILPLVFFYLAFSIAYGALGEEILKKIPLYLLT